MPVGLLSHTHGIEKNKMNFWVALLLAMKHGFTLYAWKQTVISAVEARNFDKPSELQGTAICRQDRKIMAYFLWDTKVVHTVNRDYYCTLLFDQLQLAICIKRPGLQQKDVILQLDNAVH